MVAIFAAVAVAIVLVGVHPWSRAHGSSTDHASSSSTSILGRSTTTFGTSASTAGSTIPASSSPAPTSGGASSPTAALEAALPTASMMDVLVPSGLTTPVPADVRWSLVEHETVRSSAADRAGTGACLPAPGLIAQAYAHFGYLDAQGGIYGQAVVSTRHFASAADASSWVAAHRAATARACLGRENRKELIAETLGGTIIQDSTSAIPAPAGGVGVNYLATYRASGRTCTEHADEYFVARGSDTVTADYQTCNGDGFAPLPEQQLTSTILAALPA